MSALSDRELLELVIKALGITGYVCEDWTGLYVCTPAQPDVPRSEPVFYRWLINDGDALRLAVKLRLEMNIEDYGASVRAAGGRWYGCEAHMHKGIEAATRRAIVLAAAAIGESLP
jgi:hypothetical protein